MMRTIWKYALKLTDEQRIGIPRGSQFLTAQFQGEQLVAWAVVEDEQPIDERVIYIVGSGDPLPSIPVKYIGTAQEQEPERPFVWHVFVENRS